MTEDAEWVATSDERGRPDIFPLPTGVDFCFAIHGGYDFGWRMASRRSTEPEFIIRKFSPLRTKELGRFPITPTGWAEAWEAIIALDPGLQTAIREKLLRVRRSIENAELVARRKEQDEALESVAQQELDALAVMYELPGCVLLGGFGYNGTAVPGEALDFHFTEGEIVVTAAGRALPRFRRTYEQTDALEFSGPGVVSSGGGFIGGGFGFKGAAEGMIAASILNRLTTRHKIHTLLRLQANDLEAFFFCSTKTPQSLRMELAEVLHKIRDARERQSRTLGPDVGDQLAQLGQMFQDGLLSTEEFAAAKGKLLGS